MPSVTLSERATMPYFEFIGEDLSRKSATAEKYWEITQVGKNVTVRFGKIGADGQLKVKEFDTKEEAEAEVAKLIKEKTKKGYVEKPNPHA
jgi:predicted DNA-binding WGR domain protein